MINKDSLAEGGSAKVSILRNLFTKNSDAIVVTDNGLIIVFANQVARDYFSHYSELQEGRAFNIHFPELNLQEKELIKLSKGESITLSIRRNGHIIDFSASPMELEQEELVLFILRKKATSSAPYKESLFKPLIQQSPIATGIFSPSGKPVYLNKAYSDLFSVPIDKMDYILENYSLLEDEQLLDSGLLSFVEKGFSGESVEIPTFLYNPSRTSSLKVLGSDIEIYLKGSIFPVKDENGIVREIVIALTDVTYQKQAEHILTEAHLKFQMLNLNLPGAIYEYETAQDHSYGKFIYMSQGCQSIFEIEPERVISDPDIIDRMIHPEDLPQYEASLARVKFDNDQWEWEGRVIVKDKIKWIEARSSRRQQPDGRLISYGVLLDITEKKKAEEQYKTIEDRLKLALQSADISLWEWQEETGRVYLNDQWIEKQGYNKSEHKFLASNWHKLVHPEDLPLIDSQLKDLKTGLIDFFEIEYRLKTKNGDWSWILDKGKAVTRCSEGVAVKVVGTQVDINERKLSEAIIKKNEQLFTQLFENSPLGIVLLDETHKVVQMNKGFEDLFGFTKKEILGNALNTLIVPHEFTQEAHDINIMTGSGKVGKLESVRRKRNGELVPVIIYGVPVLFNKKTIGVYGIYVDISDRKKAEKELQIRNNELDNFVYKVSHDLRAPLSSILGLVNLANNQLNNDDPRTYIPLIGQRVRQLDAFISDVLSHSKNLKLEVTYNIIDFEEIIQRCLRELSYLSGAERIKHNISIKGKKFYSDHWRINEIFRNLISNAIKYMDPGKKEPFIDINIEAGKECLKMTFSDNGLGIEKALQPRIFEMFYRATVYSEGSGIGLYIVKNAIEILGGTINVSSELQKGTTFVIEIPNRKPLR